MTTRSDQPFLGALAARAQHPLIEVDVSQLQSDRLRGAQPAGVHHLKQRPVAQRERLAATRLREQSGDLLATEHRGQALGWPRPTQVRGRIVLEQFLAAQMTVEGAQARDLALQRRRRDRRTLLAAGCEPSEERGKLAVAGAEQTEAARWRNSRS